MRRLYGYEGPRWVCYFWFVGWDCLSLGFHVCLRGNPEVHVPFGFTRVGRRMQPSPAMITIRIDR